MSYPKQATVIGRGLGRELRALRDSKRMSCRKVAEQLGWQASKISRMETGNQGIRLADLASLLVVYGVIGKERDRLLKMAERSEESGYWESQPALSKESKTLIRLERDAIGITTFHPLLIPGLVQTPDYVRAMMRVCRVSGEDLDSRVAARLARQAVLAKEEPPTLRLIVDEGVLRRVLGSPKVMTRQLRHLVEATERPGISLQVLPNSLHGHSGVDGSFHILDFERAKPVVYLDHKISGLFLEEPEQIAYFREEVDSLSAVALSPADSVELVATIAQEHSRE